MARIKRNGNHLANRLEGDWTNDEMFGYAGNDTIYGYAGDDIIYGQNGSDFLHGGVGNDSVYGGANRDFVFGNAGNDQLFGGDGDDFLLGGMGADTLSGGRGNDVLIGARDTPQQKDTVVLDATRDTFVFDFEHYVSDRVRGFEAGIDVVDIDNARLAGINRIEVTENFEKVAGKDMSVVTLTFKSAREDKGVIKFEGYDLDNLAKGGAAVVNVNPFQSNIDADASAKLNALLSKGTITDLVF